MFCNTLHGENAIFYIDKTYSRARADYSHTIKRKTFKLCRVACLSAALCDEDGSVLSSCFEHTGRAAVLKYGFSETPACLAIAPSPV